MRLSVIRVRRGSSCGFTCSRSTRGRMRSGDIRSLRVRLSALSCRDSWVRRFSSAHEVMGIVIVMIAVMMIVIELIVMLVVVLIPLLVVMLTFPARIVVRVEGILRAEDVVKEVPATRCKLLLLLRVAMVMMVAVMAARSAQGCANRIEDGAKNSASIRAVVTAVMTSVLIVTNF